MICSPMLSQHLPGTFLFGALPERDDGRPLRARTADFVQKIVNKTAVQDLTIPIAGVTALDNLDESIINDNPFGCVGYTGSDGVLIDLVVRISSYLNGAIRTAVEA